MLSLSEALKNGRLQEFIAQEEARGVKPVHGSELDIALAFFIKSRRLEDRTSHSASAGGSTGK